MRDKAKTLTCLWVYRMLTIGSRVLSPFPGGGTLPKNRLVIGNVSVADIERAERLKMLDQSMMCNIIHDDRRDSVVHTLDLLVKKIEIACEKAKRKEQQLHDQQRREATLVAAKSD